MGYRAIYEARLAKRNKPLLYKLPIHRQLADLGVKIANLDLLVLHITAPNRLRLTKLPCMRSRETGV
ncbi:MAG: hypothetical protein ACREFW_08295 [Rhizomicrobium sp.]